MGSTHRHHPLNLLTALLLSVGLGLVPGCLEVGDQPTGRAHIAVQTNALGLDDIARVEITISGPGIAPAIVTDLAGDPGSGWSGTVADIPPGADRTFTGRAYDALDVLIYEGEAAGVTVIADEMSLVTIFMQQVEPPDPYYNTAPRFTGLSVSAYSVAPGGTISLSVTAEDPDPGDSLTYAWSAGSGTFSTPDSPSTDWTAPASSGSILLQVHASDDSGATAVLEIGITVANGLGSAYVGVDINTAPEITSLVPNPTRIDVGETAYLDLTASDPDGDGLSYSWSVTGCTGTFDDPTGEDPGFTLEDAVPGWTDCLLSVTVSDRRGASNTATVSIASGPGICDGDVCGPDQHQPGELIWSETSSFSGNDGPGAIAFSATGEVVVAGDIEGNDTNRAMAFRVYDPDGVYMRWDWIDDAGLDYRVDAAATDSLGNGYLVGQVYDGADTEIVVQQNIGWSDSWGWVATFPGIGAFDVEVDANDDVWVMGISGTSEPYNLWVGRFDPAGGPPADWSDTVQLTNIWPGGGLAIHPTGDVVVCVSYDEDGNDDVFLRRYTPAGAVVWTTVWDTNWNYRCEDVAIDAMGNIIVTGSYYTGVDPDLWVAKFDSAGAFIDSVTLHDGGDETGRAVTIAPNGTIYIAGDSTATGAFLKAYFPGLIERWTVRPGGTIGADVKLDTAGDIFMGGITVDFGDDLWVGKFAH